MEIMATVIVKHGGTIDKYIGDCIMSLFNVPQDVPNHASAATMAAVECLQALKKKNVEWKNRYGRELNCRIGIHTGEVLVGNMGSEHRMNYTAIGDNVNIAARLEPVNKLFSTHIVVSKAVYKKLQKGKFLTRKLAKLKVSGKQVAHSIYEVSDEEYPSKALLFSLYEQALKAYKNKKFENALSLIKEALLLKPDDGTSKRLKEKIEDNIGTIVDMDWNYIESLLHK